MLSEQILRQSFSRAHQRLGLVLLDLVWKAVWLILIATAVLLVVAWFGSELHGIAWEDTGVPGVNALVVGMVLREFWIANSGPILAVVAVLAFLSVTGWFLLESFARRRMVFAVGAV